MQEGDMKFPTLYGKDSKGNLRVWTIKIEGNAVTVEHGREDGKLTSKTYYTKGKNLGRSNETTPEEQAELEAQAKHTTKTWLFSNKRGSTQARRI